jgi:MFS family permease
MSSGAEERQLSPSLLGSLAPHERRFVLQQRTIQCLNSFMHIISTTAHYQSYLEQVNGDVARLALHYGRTMSINNACNTFIAPVVGSLSDTFGRRTLHWLGRAGAAIFFMLMPLNHMRFLANPGNAAVQQSVLQTRMAIEILGFGVLTAGNWGIFAAAHTDLFADRPSLSSRLQAADQMWKDAISGPASLAAAFLTPILWCVAASLVLSFRIIYKRLWFWIQKRTHPTECVLRLRDLDYIRRVGRRATGGCCTQPLLHSAGANWWWLSVCARLCPPVLSARPSRSGALNCYCEMHNNRPNFALFPLFSGGAILRIAPAQSGVFNRKLGDYYIMRYCSCTACMQLGILLLYNYIIILFYHYLLPNLIC